ncbi:MAG: zinc-binding dehydrogenase [Propionibacteriaceae bacterium]|jgi:L-idonate 5-dehydrogenase|nr:zinc-binding dehydrogenase [Propionibacteriaceae bacterium]
MRALLLTGPQTASVEEIETPEPGAGQIRVKVAYAGVCISDATYFRNGGNGPFKVKEPLSLGHENSAVVDLDPEGEYAQGTPCAVRPAVFGTPKEGQEGWAPHLVPGMTYLGSASTDPHTQGGTREYLIVNRDQVVPLVEGTPLKRAALAEPTTIALHCIGLAGGVEGKKVLVNGSGPIGMVAIITAKAKGAASVAAADPVPEALERAKGVGADETYLVGVDKVPTSAFDVVIDCIGVQDAINTDVDAARPGGFVGVIGMSGTPDTAVPLGPLQNKEVRITGNFRLNDEMPEAVQLLAAHPEYDQVYTHEFDLDHAADAFLLEADPVASAKCVIRL